MQKHEKCVFLIFDPNHIFQRARWLADVYGAGSTKTEKYVFRFLTRTVFCSELDRTNIQLGSKNWKSLSSGLMTRTVCFSECERDTYTVRVEKQENCVSGFLTRTVYFSELELAEIYSSGEKTGKQNLQVFRPEPCTSASSSLQKYTVRVKKRKTVPL